ncbi:MAG: phage tail protein [Burkholderiales bacterium]|nr:phage tail protein [Burkholderiales bacterium]
MIVYQTRPDGVFVGYVEADESPLESGVFLIPGLCVAEEPPEFGEGFQARRVDGEWVIEPVPEPEPEPTVPTIEIADPVDRLRLFLGSNPDVAALLMPPSEQAD